MPERHAFRLHPWHGVAIGSEAPAKVTAFIEIVPTDTVKYELDKATGLLKIDRPQLFSNVCPALYGFVPRTLCGDACGALASRKTGRPGIVGDGDPLDLCVLSEKPVTHGDILVTATVIGGFAMLDGNEADDKIVAVLEGDAVYGGWRELADAPASLVDRLRHYFLTYKQLPDAPRRVTIPEVYGREGAYEVIAASREDYDRKYPE